MTKLTKLAVRKASDLTTAHQVLLRPNLLFSLIRYAITSENVYASARPCLLADGNGLALRVQSNGAKTWLFLYRRPRAGKENFLSLGPTPILRSLMRDGRFDHILL
jgi:hypothetical protein